MAQTSLTLNYDSILTTTLFNVRGILYDQIFKSNVFMNWLHQKGRKRVVNGGERIQVALQTGTNSTVKTYSGYELLDTTPQDNVTSAFYNWKQLAGSVAINRLEERQNSGEAQIMSLLQQKVNELQLSMADELSREILGPNGAASGSTFAVGNGGKDLLGLPIIIQDAPATGSLVGGINSADSSFWRNQTTDSTATTTKAYKDELRKMWNDCSKGPGGGPDMVLATQTAYEHYESALNDHSRHTNLALADLGFDNVRLKGANVVWDERVPDSENQEYSSADGGNPSTETAYFINSKFLELVVDSQTDFITTPFVRPENQDARVAQVLFYGELTCNNRRKQGVLASIQTAALTPSTG
ncbi:MAG: phage major capsid protein [Dehalococcoidia bacterium]